RFHCLRHSTATLLLRAKVDAHRVQRILRHASINTTLGTYGHLTVEDLREAVATLPTAPAFVEPHAATESPTASAGAEQAGPPADQTSLRTAWQRVGPFPPAPDFRNGSEGMGSGDNTSDTSI